jgi:3-oxoadipate enol-lactonase
MDFAARHAGRLKTLMLCDTHKGFAGMSQEARTAFIASRKEPLINGKEPKDIAGPVAKTLLGPNASQAAYEALVDSMSRLHKESYIKSIEASVNMDVRSDLGNIRVPTLVVVGSADRLTTVDMAQSIAGDIPGAELSVIDGAGHLVNIEEPEQFNSIVIDFLNRKLNR